MYEGTDKVASLSGWCRGMRITCTWRKLPVYLRTALLWVIMQQVVVISYRGFGTTYQSHLQGSRIS